MIVCVDVQHIGKRNRPNDRGAFAFGRTEVSFTEAYGTAIKDILEGMGHKVYLSIESLTDGILDGNYGERHDFANRVGADLYLACHVNAGAQADYSLTEIQYNAFERTFWLAKTIAQNFRDRIPTSKAYVKRLKPANRGWSCIDGIKGGSAILLEPFFIDNQEDHEFASTEEGIQTIAMCVTDAVQEWMELYPELNAEEFSVTEF